MEKKECDTEWAAMDLFEKLNMFGAASEFGGRIIFGVTESVDKQKWTAQLDSLLSDWVWSLFERYDATHEEKVYDIYDGYHSIQEMVADSSDDPAVQEKFVRLIAYLMDHAGSAEDHCLNLITGIMYSFKHMGMEFQHALKSMYLGNQWRVHVAKALAWEFDKNPDSMCHLLLEWIMSAPGAGASINGGQIDSSNDGIGDCFGWGLHFGPRLITDYDRIMNQFIKVLNEVDNAAETMHDATGKTSFWDGFYADALKGWEDGWHGIESALTGLYVAIDEVCGGDGTVWQAPEYGSKLAVLTPAQVLASIFGSNVIVTKEGV